MTGLALFIGGLVVGATLGVIVMAVLSAAGSADLDLEREFLWSPLRVREILRHHDEHHDEHHEGLGGDRR